MSERRTGKLQLRHRVGVYTLRVMAPDDFTDEENREVLGGLGDLLCDIEDQISSQLPEGYYCKIDEQGW